MRPIILSRGKVSETTDSAGVSIRKTTLAKPGPPGPYEFTQHAPTSTEVPSLAFFCINALVPYPEQVSMDFQLPYDAPNPEKRDLLTELNADEPSQVDPRLWAILVQLYSGLPHQWYTYHIPLGDRHLPLLQCIPSTEHFALITVLELSGSREVNDDTIFELKQLRTLVALDLSATELSTLGVLHLANTVAWASTEASQPEMRGPWALRILDLRGCKKINQDALPYLDSFKLLSVVDVRWTSCKLPLPKSCPFRTASSEEMVCYHPAPLVSAVDFIGSCVSAFSHSNPHTLLITKTKHPEAPLKMRQRATPKANMHNTFVVLPSHNKPVIVGNSDILARKVEAVAEAERYAKNLEAWYENHPDADRQGFQEPPARKFLSKIRIPTKRQLEYTGATLKTSAVQSAPLVKISRGDMSANMSHRPPDVPIRSYSNTRNAPKLPIPQAGRNSPSENRNTSLSILSLMDLPPRPQSAVVRNANNAPTATRNFYQPPRPALPLRPMTPNSSGNPGLMLFREPPVWAVPQHTSASLAEANVSRLSTAGVVDRSKGHVQKEVLQDMIRRRAVSLQTTASHVARPMLPKNPFRATLPNKPGSTLSESVVKQLKPISSIAAPALPTDYEVPPPKKAKVPPKVQNSQSNQKNATITAMFAAQAKQAPRGGS